MKNMRKIASMKTPLIKTSLKKPHQRTNLVGLLFQPIGSSNRAPKSIQQARNLKMNLFFGILDWPTYIYQLYRLFPDKD